MKLIYLFNGHLLVPKKQEQFKKWLEVFNKQYGYNILYMKSLVKPNFDSMWLCGFIDAEGCFTARVKDCHTSKAKKNLFVDFEITQKENNILIDIKNLFQLSTNTNIKYDRSWNGYKFYLSNKTKLLPLVNDLKKKSIKNKKAKVFFSMVSNTPFRITKNALNL